MQKAFFLILFLSFFILPGSVGATPPTDLQIREAKAEKAVAPGVLATLSRDSEERVRRLVARNEHTSSGTLFTLSKDKAVSVRQAVAANPGYYGRCPQHFVPRR